MNAHNLTDSGNHEGGPWLFKEEQHFTQWWLWLVLLLLLCIPLVGIIQQLVYGKPFGSDPMSDTGLIFFGVGMLTFCLFFRLMNLKTRVNRELLLIRFYPILTKRIYWRDVARAEIIQYGFVGYGIKLWTPYGTVYNIKGNKGLSLILKNDKKLLLGSQKVTDLERILKLVMPEL